MAKLDFFAARADHKAIVEFLLSDTDVRVFESYSEYGQKLREFQSFRDLSTAYDVGVDRNGNGSAILLQLWSPSVSKKFKTERMKLDPRYCDGHTFWYCVEGWGLIQLYLGGVHRRVITVSHYGHNTKARATAWGHAEGVDWKALTKLSNRIQYHIRERLAVARVPGRPILSQAYKRAKDGYALKETAQTSWQYELNERDE